MTTNDTTPNQPQPQSHEPRTLRKVLLIVGSLVLAFLILGSTLQLIGLLNRKDNSGTYQISAPFDSIEVDTTASDVKVAYGEVAEPEVVFSQGGSNLKFEYSVSDDELSIRVISPGWNFWSWDWLRWNFGGWGEGAGSMVSITLPRSLEGTGIELSLESTAGNVDVAGDFGDIDLKTTAGDIQLAGSAEELEIEATAGDVNVVNFRVSDSLSSTATAGDISLVLASLPESIDLSSTAGDVRVVLPSGSYRIETRTTAGEVQQHASSDANSTRVYSFESTAGDIQIRER